jgi:two-component system nitrate/nitrite response regulator NarP
LKILIADDHPMIRTAIEALLRETPFEIAGSAASGAQALERVAELKPDLVLLDLQMPEGSGMDVLRTLRSSANGPRVVVLTAAIEDSLLMEARALKVDGIVLKNSDPAYLIDCLESVRGGKSWIDPELRERIAAIGADGSARRLSLAPRERELIQCIRRGLRNRDIASHLGVTEGTVKVYLHRIFEKLGVKNRTELAIRADKFLAESYARK